MAIDDLIDSVNRLYALESCSLMQRLAESQAYIPTGANAEAFDLQRMIDEETQHGASLVTLLDELNTTPGPRGVSIMSGNLHYNQLHVLLPRLIEDKHRLIGEYQAALSIAEFEPRAADVLGRLLASHRRHLARLEELAQQAPA
jgi:hypothetical protein